MTFYNNQLNYRVTLDTEQNVFVVYLENTPTTKATGITIEQAVQALQHQIH